MAHIPGSSIPDSLGYRWGQPSVSLWARWFCAPRAQPEGADSIPSGWSSKSYLEGGPGQGISASSIRPRFLSQVQNCPLNSALGCAMTLTRLVSKIKFLIFSPKSAHPAGFPISVTDNSTGPGAQAKIFGIIFDRFPSLFCTSPSDLSANPIDEISQMRIPWTKTHIISSLGFCICSLTALCASTPAWLNYSLVEMHTGACPFSAYYCQWLH